MSEVLAGWAAAIGGAWAAYRFLPEAAAPFAAAFAWIAVAVGFPLARGRSLEAAGLAWKSPLRTLRAVALYSGVFLPLFAVGWLALAPRAFDPGGPWRFPGFEMLLAPFISNLFFAGLPEECFFRGFVQPLLASRTPAPAPPRRVIFVPVSRTIVCAAALFALTHVVFEPDPFTLAAAGRLATFFPGLLFGALREETGDVVAPALFHALCNATLYTLQRGYVT